MNAPSPIRRNDPAEPRGHHAGGPPRPRGIHRHPALGRADWLDLRRGYVGASDIAPLFGLCPHRTRLDLYLDKRDGEASGDTVEAKRGRWLEPAAFAALADERPNLGATPADEIVTCSVRRMCATPDGYASDGAPVQIKAPTMATADEWASGPPLRYRLQVLAECMVTDAPHGWLVPFMVDAFGADVVAHRIERHEGAEARIAAGVEAFWDELEAGRVPALDLGREGAALARMFPEPEGEPLDWTGNNRLTSVVATRHALAGEASSLKAQVAALDDEIKAAIGDASGARLPGFTIDWPVRRRRAYSVAAGTTRTLNIKEQSE